MNEVLDQSKSQFTTLKATLEKTEKEEVAHTHAMDAASIQLSLSQLEHNKCHNKASLSQSHYEHQLSTYESLLTTLKKASSNHRQALNEAKKALSNESELKRIAKLENIQRHDVAEQLKRRYELLSFKTPVPIDPVSYQTDITALQESIESISSDIAQLIKTKDALSNQQALFQTRLIEADVNYDTLKTLEYQMNQCNHVIKGITIPEVTQLCHDKKELEDDLATKQQEVSAIQEQCKTLNGELLKQMDKRNRCIKALLRCKPPSQDILEEIQIKSYQIRLRHLKTLPNLVKNDVYLLMEALYNSVSYGIVCMTWDGPHEMNIITLEYDCLLYTSPSPRD